MENATSVKFRSAGSVSVYWYVNDWKDKKVHANVIDFIEHPKAVLHCRLVV